MDAKGVVFASPTIIQDSIRRQVDKILLELPEDGVFVRLDIQLATGSNAVFGYRKVGERWKVAAGGWVGKSWETGSNWDAGASVTVGVRL